MNTPLSSDDPEQPFLAQMSCRRLAMNMPSHQGTTLLDIHNHIVSGRKTAANHTLNGNLVGLPPLCDWAVETSRDGVCSHWDSCKRKGIFCDLAAGRSFNRSGCSKCGAGHRVSGHDLGLSGRVDHAAGTAPHRAVNRSSACLSGIQCCDCNHRQESLRIHLVLLYRCFPTTVEFVDPSAAKGFIGDGANASTALMAAPHLRQTQNSTAQLA